MKIQLIILTILFSILGYSQTFTNSVSTYTQDFTIGNSATATLPSGWKITNAGGAQLPNYTTAQTATNQVGHTSGTGVMVYNSPGGTYNFGVTSASPDRAIGFLSSSNTIGTVPRYIFLRIQNSTSCPINNLAIAFDYEKYRKGINSFSFNFYHGADPNNVLTNLEASGSQTYAADPLVGADYITSNTVVNPPTTISKSFTINVNIPVGSYYYLCWRYTSGSSNNGQALGIDNVSVTAFHSIISADTTITSDIDYCSLKVNSPATLIIDNAATVNVQNNFVNNGVVDIRDKASVTMNTGSTLTNTGIFYVRKTTPLYNRFDYIYVSSPITSNTIANTFGTWRTDYSFVYSPLIDNWTFVGPSGFMTPGVGYIVMTTTTGIFPQITSITFAGTINNGDINVSLANSINKFNLVGNPYPSSISANAFITQNASNIDGTLYFWRHNTPISSATPGSYVYNYSPNDYATYNLTGGVVTTAGSTPVPNGFIPSGQSFMIKTLNNNAIVFNNDMRNITYDNDNFYRTNTSSKRIWLNMTNTDGVFSQQLIGYINGTSLDYDNLYDGKVIGVNTYINFYSMIDMPYKIQARGSFSENDIIPLGYISNITGDFSIAIGETDNFNEDVFLEDTFTQTIHNLKTSPYSFQTEVGTFNDRFKLRYNSTSLATTHFQSQVGFTYVDNILNIKSQSVIDRVEIYDTTGRVLHKENVGGKDFSLSIDVKPIIVKVFSDDLTYTNKLM